MFGHEKGPMEEPGQGQGRPHLRKESQASELGKDLSLALQELDLHRVALPGSKPSRPASYRYRPQSLSRLFRQKNRDLPSVPF